MLDLLVIFGVYYFFGLKAAFILAIIMIFTINSL